jgi:hypothetical protein
VSFIYTYSVFFSGGLQQYADQFFFSLILLRKAKKGLIFDLLSSSVRKGKHCRELWA